MGESNWPRVEAVSALFCHVQDLKQRDEASSGHVVFCIAVTYMLKKMNELTKGDIT